MAQDGLDLAMTLRGDGQQKRGVWLIEVRGLANRSEGLRAGPVDKSEGFGGQAGPGPVDKFEGFGKAGLALALSIKVRG